VGKPGDDEWEVDFIEGSFFGCGGSWWKGGDHGLVVEVCYVWGIGGEGEGEEGELFVRCHFVGWAVGIGVEGVKY